MPTPEDERIASIKDMHDRAVRDPYHTPTPVFAWTDVDVLLRRVAEKDAEIAELETHCHALGKTATEAQQQNIKDQAEIAALRAQVEWRLISEYRREEHGERVLVSTDDGAVGEARYHEDRDGWWWARTDPTDAHDGQVRYPTDFRPLPAPPGHKAVRAANADALDEFRGFVQEQLERIAPDCTMAAPRQPQQQDMDVETALHPEPGQPSNPAVAWDWSSLDWERAVLYRITAYLAKTGEWVEEDIAALRAALTRLDALAKGAPPTDTTTGINITLPGSPDAEAMAQIVEDILLGHEDRRPEATLNRRIAAALTAYAVREREAIERLIEEAIQSVTSPGATAARTMARTILSMVRARSAKEGK